MSTRLPFTYLPTHVLSIRRENLLGPYVLPLLKSYSLSSAERPLVLPVLGRWILCFLFPVHHTSTRADPLVRAGRSERAAVGTTPISAEGRSRYGTASSRPVDERNGRRFWSQSAKSRRNWYWSRQQCGWRANERKGSRSAGAGASNHLSDTHVIQAAQAQANLHHATQQARVAAINATATQAALETVSTQLPATAKVPTPVAGAPAAQPRRTAGRYALADFNIQRT